MLGEPARAWEPARPEPAVVLAVVRLGGGPGRKPDGDRAARHPDALADDSGARAGRHVLQDVDHQHEVEGVRGEGQRRAVGAHREHLGARAPRGARVVREVRLGADEAPREELSEPLRARPHLEDMPRAPSLDERDDRRVADELAHHGERVGRVRLRSRRTPPVVSAQARCLNEPSRRASGSQRDSNPESSHALASTRNR